MKLSPLHVLNLSYFAATDVSNFQRIAIATLALSRLCTSQAFFIFQVKSLRAALVSDPCIRRVSVKG